MDEKKSVLIVDDEESLRTVLSMKLTEEGIIAYTAKDGDEALKVAFDKKPSLILLDIMMPHTDGLQVLETLRKDPWGAKVPTVLLTNSNSLDAVSKAVTLGSTDYIVKTDISLAEVVVRVKAKLGL